MPAQDQLVDLDFKGTSRVLGLPTPLASDEAASMGYVDGIFGGWAWKDNVRAASTANVNLASPGSSIDAITLASGDRVLIKDQTAPAENGIYIWNGAATPMTRSADANAAVELESARVQIDEGTANGGTEWRQTSVNFTLDSGSIVWASVTTSVPDATEAVKGKAELATQAEADAGTNDVTVLTPLKVANLAGRFRRHAADIGDASATQFDITHNFGSYDVAVEIFRNSGSRDTVGCLISRPSTNAVRLNFSAAPSSNQFRVVIKY